MATTPLWVPLAVAGLAVVGTLAGVVFTQIWNSRLEERRWARDSERLREAQAREDTNRTYEHRRAAYVDFLQELERLERRYITLNREPIEPPARYGPAFDSLYERFSAVELYGTEEAQQMAVVSLVHLEGAATDPRNSQEADDFWNGKAAYVTQIREELGVPERGSLHSNRAT